MRPMDLDGAMACPELFSGSPPRLFTDSAADAEVTAIFRSIAAGSEQAMNVNFEKSLRFPRAYSAARVNTKAPASDIWAAMWRDPCRRATPSGAR